MLKANHDLNYIFNLKIPKLMIIKLGKIQILNTNIP